MISVAHIAHTILPLQMNIINKLLWLNNIIASTSEPEIIVNQTQTQEDR